MSDRQTGSVWTHYDGTVLTGPLAAEGVRLELQPLVHMTWEDWQAAYPDSLVLDWIDQYADRYQDVQIGTGGVSARFQATILNFDARLPENELVLGVQVGDESRAYLMDDFPPGPSVIEDELGGSPIVVLADGSSGFALAYSAVVEGALLAFGVEGGDYVDATGSVWDESGVAASGPLAGTRLDFATSFVTEWYGWAAYHPGTTIYTG